MTKSVHELRLSETTRRPCEPVDRVVRGAQMSALPATCETASGYLYELAQEKAFATVKIARVAINPLGRVARA